MRITVTFEFNATFDAGTDPNDVADVLMNLLDNALSTPGVSEDNGNVEVDTITIAEHQS